MNPIFLTVAGKIAEKYFDDKSKKTKFLAELENNSLALEKSLIDARAETISSELSGGVLQRNWRPLLMLCAIIIIFNNYVIFPYARAFGLDLPLLELPAGLWALLTTGVGGYVMGRSAEKITRRGI